MQALRKRVACAASRARPSANPLPSATRFYAAGHGPDGHHDAHHDDHHHHDHGVSESIGVAPFAVLGAIGSAVLLYKISRPGENGELSTFAQWVDSLRTQGTEKWAERNTLRTEVFEQAAKDRNLFRTVPRRDFQYRTPEYVEARNLLKHRPYDIVTKLLHGGCVRNVRAGSVVDLDHVVEHYRKKHLEEEERKAKKMAEAK